MQTICRVLRIAGALAALVCALGVSAQAQISVISPTEGEQASMPVWLRADAANCNGYPVNSFGYSINSSAFMNWGFSDSGGWHVDNIDFQIASQSPAAAFTIHYKAWSSGGECTADVDVNVNGNSTTEVYDLQTWSNTGQSDNGFYGNLELCPQTSQVASATPGNWWWDWDTGTGQCTYPEVGVNSSDNTTSYAGVTNPSQDGNSRVFYTVWQSSGGNPGERYSIDYANDSTPNYFVYNTYIYIPSPYPQNLEVIQLDTNWVDPNGNPLIFGMQCVHSTGTWEFSTEDANNNTTWRDPIGTGWTQAPCDPQSWTTNSTPDGWHHVELAYHRDNSGDVIYDYIVVDAHYTTLSNGWYGYGTYQPQLHGDGPWNPGDLVLNFQVDGIDNNGNEATAAVYADGMEMIRGVNLWSSPSGQ